MDLIHSERTKLLANFIDRFGTGCLIVGFATPLNTAMHSGVSQLGWADLGMAGVWILATIGLHYGARMALGSLKP